MAQQAAETERRLENEWDDIAEERRLLNEERTLLEEERRTMEDEKRSLAEDRKRVDEKEREVEIQRRVADELRSVWNKEREDAIAMRSRAEEGARGLDAKRTEVAEFVRVELRKFEEVRSGIEEEVQTLRRTARELAGDASPSSPEGRPAKRPRRTPGGPEMRSDPTILPETSTRPTSPRNGTDPSGLSAASDEMKNLWRQIEFPQEWTKANSDNLFELFTKHTGKKVLPGSRPVALLDALATRNGCLINRLKKTASNLDNGKAHPCSVCRSRNWPCIAVDFTVAGPDNEPYDEDEQGKRWKLSIRKD